MQFIRVFAATALCFILFWIISALFLSDEPNLLLRVLWYGIFMMLFLWPFSLPALAILTVVNYILDRSGVRHVLPYVLLWPVMGGVLWSVVVGPSLEIFNSSPIAALSGAVYWVLMGRIAGTPHRRSGGPP